MRFFNKMTIAAVLLATIFGCEDEVARRENAELRTQLRELKRRLESKLNDTEEVVSPVPKSSAFTVPIAEEATASLTDRDWEVDSDVKKRLRLAELEEEAMKKLEAKFAAAQEKLTAAATATKNIPKGKGLPRLENVTAEIWMSRGYSDDVLEHREPVRGWRHMAAIVMESTPTECDDAYAIYMMLQALPTPDDVFIHDNGRMRQIAANASLIRKLGPWVVRVAKYMPDSRIRDCMKSALLLVWTTLNQDFTELSEVVAEDSDYVYRHPLQGVFLRRWLDAGGSTKGDNLILTYRFWAAKIAREFSLPNAPSWARSIAGDLQTAKGFPKKSWYLKQISS